MGASRLIAGLLASLVMLGCGANSKNVKIYYLEPAQGLVRKQEQEVLPFPKARGYLCTNRADLEIVVTCVEGVAKVYYLDPSRGLVRKQSGEVRSFTSSRGFLCTSPDDFKLLLEDCQAQEGGGQ
jgi:ABC-type uncharacterized transport system auxiliary subunit